MTGRVTFTIPGDAQPCERARRGARGHWYTPAKTRAFEEAVGWAWRAAGAVCFGGQPLTFSAQLYLERPSSHFTRAGKLIERCSLAVPGGDLDNYCKSILDGLQKAGAFTNDKQVVCFSGVGKHWALRGHARTEVDLWVARPLDVGVVA